MFIVNKDYHIYLSYIETYAYHDNY